jgi:hypothetical protein
MYTYKILQRLSLHSFLNYQISVVTMSDKQGKVHNGIAVLPAPDLTFSEMSTVTGDFDQPLKVDHRQALLLCRFIGKVLDGSLPEKIEVKTNGPVLKIHLKKFIPKWYGGGGYRGQVYFKSLFSFLPFISSATIAKGSLSSLRDNLIRLYELEKMQGMD